MLFYFTYLSLTELCSNKLKNYIMNLKYVGIKETFKINVPHIYNFSLYNFHYPFICLLHALCFLAFRWKFESLIFTLFLNFPILHFRFIPTFTLLSSVEKLHRGFWIQTTFWIVQIPLKIFCWEEMGSENVVVGFLAGI